MLGLALFNRRTKRLCLAESGDPVLDSPFVEHNAPLVASGPQAAEVTEALLRAAWGVPGAGRLVLGGVAPEVLAAAGGTPWRVQERPAPWIDLRAVPGTDWLGTLSANARYQIRRSNRRLVERGGGGLAIAAAADLVEALAWLDAMMALHGETWRRRGQPGAFADPFAVRFHRALVGRLFARGELDLLRITAGPALVVGYLYNFRRHGRVYAYQSGFRQAEEGSHEKPGLTCHALAVARSIAMGDVAYDFLAGAHRYKLSLANATQPLLWAELVPTWSPRGIVARAARALRRPAASSGG
jgi:CelD/BcsL family acetyltransferase involved in cellulose biosynthesis